MSTDKTNNPESTPDKGQVDDKAGGERDISKLSLDELTDEELERKVKAKPASEPEPVTDTETETDKGIEATDELPENLKGKSADELAKDYINLRK